MADGESSPTKTIQEPWYRTAFGAHYVEVYAHRDEFDALRAVKCCVGLLSLNSSSVVLDLCCGAGRHIRVFEDLGIPVLGLDLSEDLLHEAVKQDLNSPLVRGDMRSLPFAAGSFDAIVNLFTSFGYFSSEEEHLGVLREVRRVLKREGKAVFDLMNPTVVEKHLKQESTEHRGDVVIQARRSINKQTKRVEKQVKIENEGKLQVDYVESVRLFTPSEFDDLLAHAGLDVVERVGDFDGQKFDENSSLRQIVVAVKA